MADIMKQVMPAGVPLDMIDAVTEEVSVDTSPPEGVILHAHRAGRLRPHPGRVGFRCGTSGVSNSRLMPAMAKVAAARGFDRAAAEPPSEPEIT